ncbi:MAG TPA: GNAT family protein [Gemmatimonadales bacterium]|nr:GNAT family protein [Gemmatimonadales bacterium]
MRPIAPVVLEGGGVRLEPLTADHGDALATAASDGRLWELWYTSVPAPDETADYIAAALAGFAAGHMLPWVVREAEGGEVIGSTRYHDIISSADRVEIGYTWYAARWQRTHVNSACKRLLLSHAFETLGCGVVGLRTDIANTRSQAAIERLGARRDGVIRHQMRRRDGTIRDTVMYSIVAAEWPAIRDRLARSGPGP